MHQEHDANIVTILSINMPHLDAKETQRTNQRRGKNREQSCYTGLGLNLMRPLALSLQEQWFLLLQTERPVSPESLEEFESHPCRRVHSAPWEVRRDLDLIISLEKLRYLS